jgi:hypothetical protein
MTELIVKSYQGRLVKEKTDGKWYYKGLRAVVEEEIEEE